MTVLASLLLSLIQPAPLHTEAVAYKHGEVQLEGYLAYDPSVQGKRPGVILVHEWKGHGDYVRRRAEQVARLGYVAFAVDMYGKDVFAKDHEEAGKLAGVYFKDRSLMRARVAAGLETLAKHPLCDASRIAALGYCFGGTTVLEMARAGMNVRGVASFHGNLATPEKAAEIKAKVIVFHGADGAFIPAEVVAGFHEEMKRTKADCQFVSFSGAVHSFTVKEAGDDPSKGIAYHEASDRHSWEMLKDFLAEVLK